MNERAVRATYGSFIGAGFVFASWASRIPQVRDELGLSPSQLGLVLLAIAVGSIISLPLSGMIVSRWGSKRTVAAMAVLLGGGLLIAAAGYHVGVPVLVVGLFVLGFANGAWDVAMNVHAALVEQRIGRSIMARFHAGFSVGTVAGALVGTLMVALDVSVTLHLAVVGVIVPALVVRGVRGYLLNEAGAERPTGEVALPGSGQGPDSVGAAWREPRTLQIGVFVLAFAFAEGVGNDWVSVALIDGYDAPEAVGTLGFAMFLTAMTIGRWFGPDILDRHGRVRVVRTLAVVATVGVLLFVFGGTTPVAFVGALLLGLGVSLGFPVGMSAGADDPRYAAVRVSVIASIGYCAFLAGPPLVGFLGDHLTVLKALTSVAVLLSIAALLAGATRPPSESPS